MGLNAEKGSAALGPSVIARGPIRQTIEFDQKGKHDVLGRLS
jgi:hypothetical protein